MSDARRLTRPTHLALYRAYPKVGGVVHTHSTWATAWAQAEREIPVLGTTHADLTAEPIPVTRRPDPRGDRARLRGRDRNGSDRGGRGPRGRSLPCALVRGHAPFCWGRDPAAAVEIAVTLEEVARLALLTTALEPQVRSLDAALRAKHFERKHGPSSYYGQP